MTPCAAPHCAARCGDQRRCAACRRRAAERLIESAWAIRQPLLRLGAADERELGSRRPRLPPARRMPKPSLRSRKVAARRSAIPVRSATVGEGSHLAVQPSSGHRPIEEQDHCRARLSSARRRSRDRPPEMSLRPAASAIFFGVVLGAAVGPITPRAPAGGRARHQSGERRHYQRSESRVG